MKNKLFFCLLFVCLGSVVQAQPTVPDRSTWRTPANAAEAKLFAILDTLNADMAQNNYKTMINYIPPNIIEMIGREKLEEIYEQFAKGKMGGVEFKEMNYVILEPGKLFKSEGDLFVLIPEQMSFVSMQKRISKNGYMVAWSKDGEEWFLLNIEGEKEAQVRKMKLAFGRVPSKLSIPEVKMQVEKLE